MTDSESKALLGYHLRYRLYIDPGEADRMYLDSSYGQLVDADIMHRAGYADKPKEKDKCACSLIMIHTVK